MPLFPTQRFSDVQNTLLNLNSLVTKSNNQLTFTDQRLPNKGSYPTLTVLNWKIGAAAI